MNMHHGRRRPTGYVPLEYLTDESPRELTVAEIERAGALILATRLNEAISKWRGNAAIFALIHILDEISADLVAGKSVRTVLIDRRILRSSSDVEPS